MRERNCSSSRESFAEAKPTERPSVKLNLHSLPFPFFPPSEAKSKKSFSPPSFFAFFFFSMCCFPATNRAAATAKMCFFFHSLLFPPWKPKKILPLDLSSSSCLVFLGGKPIVVQQKNGKWLIPDFSFCYIFILFFSGSNISSVCLWEAIQIHVQSFFRRTTYTPFPPTRKSKNRFRKCEEWASSPLPFSPVPKEESINSPNLALKIILFGSIKITFFVGKLCVIVRIKLLNFSELSLLTHRSIMYHILRGEEEGNWIELRKVNFRGKEEDVKKRSNTMDGGTRAWILFLCATPKN